MSESVWIKLSNLIYDLPLFPPVQEETNSPVGSDKVADEEGEDLEDEEEYDEEEEEDDDERPRKKPKHGGFILDEAGTYGASSPPSSLLHRLRPLIHSLVPSVRARY